MINLVVVIGPSMHSRYLLGSFSLDKSQFLMFSPAKEGIFEHKHIIVLFDLVKIIHVELHESSCTCLTKDEKLECLKYLGKIYLVKETISKTTNPTSSLSQQMIFLFQGCFVFSILPPESSMSSAGKRRWFRYCAQNFDAVSIASIYNIQQMANLGLSIRIPKQSLIKLGELQGKELVIKFNGGRQVAGKLKSWDKAMNLILEGTQEMLGIDQGVETSRVLGLVIVKGSQIQSICLKNGYEVIDNPYAELAE